MAHKFCLVPGTVRKKGIKVFVDAETLAGLYGLSEGEYEMLSGSEDPRAGELKQSGHIFLPPRNQEDYVAYKDKAVKEHEHELTRQEFLEEEREREKQKSQRQGEMTRDGRRRKR